MVINVVAPVVAYASSLIITFTAVPSSEERALDCPTDRFASDACETDGPVDASAWAFAVWGVIFAGLAAFYIYQAMPSEWVPQRSDELIYVYMNLIPAINIFCNAFWFPFAIDTSQWSLVVSTFMIWAMLATALANMIIADQTEVWWPEVFIIRMTWSIYAGWSIAATLLTTSSMLKSWGMRDP